MQGPWRIATSWLAPYQLLSVLSYSTQDHQHRCGASHQGWALPCQSLMKKVFYRLAHLIEAIFQLSSPPPDDSSLCQIAINTNWHINPWPN